MDERQALESKDEREYTRSFHVPAQPRAAHNQADGSKSRWNGQEKSAKREDIRHTRFFE